MSDYYDEEEDDSASYGSVDEQIFGEIANSSLNLTRTSRSSFLKQQLHQALLQVNNNGAFAHFNKTDIYANPGLTIEGIGEIGLPLSPKDAQIIKERCHQSPFGKGSETLIDVNVRKSWELNGDQFKCANPAWSMQLDSMIKNTVKSLDMSCSPDAIEAHAYKLLLYEEGAFFRPHRDTEKEARMFGTLVVILPSKHTGGEIHLSHGGQSHVFTTSGDHYGLHYASWYADVNHEIKPVKSGYRLVLTYNLVQKGHFQAPSKQAPGLVEAFSLWNAMYRLNYHECPSMLAWKLEHKYTGFSLSIDNIKGRDQRRVHLLHNACNEHGFDLFLANIVKVEEDEYLSEHESWLKFESIYLPDGREIGGQVSFSESVIIQKKVFDREPDKEEEGEFTGNEGAPITKIYHDTVALLIPRVATVEFLTEKLLITESFSHGYYFLPDKRAQRLLALEYLRQRPESLEGPSSLKIVEMLCRGILIYTSQKTDVLQRDTYAPVIFYGTRTYPDEVIQWAVENAILSANADLIALALRVRADIPSTVFGDMRQKLKDVGMEQAKQITDIILTNTNNIASKWGILHGFLETFFGTKDFSELISSTADFSKWLDEAFEKVFEVQSPWIEKDDDAILEISILHKDLVPKRIIPYITARSSAITAMVRFLSKLTLSLASHPGETNTLLFQHGMITLASAFPSTSGHIAIMHMDPYAGTGYNTYTFIQKLDMIQLHLILHQCASDINVEVLQPCVSKILEQLYQTSKVAHAQILHKCFIPFLSQLISQKSLDSFPLISKMTKTALVYTILQRFIEKYLGPQPSSDTWARSDKLQNPQHCQDCKLLAEFIQDPDREIVAFRMAGERRKHLESQLYFGYKMQTIRGMTPLTLEIRKTTEVFEKEKREWDQRYQKAKDIVSGLDDPSGHLKSILGNLYRPIKQFINGKSFALDRQSFKLEYTAVSSLKALLQTNSPEALAESDLNQVPQRKPPQSVVPAKRKASSMEEEEEDDDDDGDEEEKEEVETEVIDLT